MPNSPLILFIDGNLSDREYYTQCLRISCPHFEIAHAATGQYGLSFCEREPVDCVVLEIDLPDMSGFEVLRRLIPHAQQHGIPVIMLTRLSNPQLLEAAVRNGAQAALCKGGTSAEILEKAMLKAFSTPQVNLTSHAEPEVGKDLLRQLASEIRLDRGKGRAQLVGSNGNRESFEVIQFFQFFMGLP